MKKGLIIFLQGVVIILGLIVLVICIFVLPRVIGSVDPNGYDPILLGIYISVIPFFIAIYQILKLLSYVNNGRSISTLSIQALNIIKYCALVISALYIVGMPYIFEVADKDDAPGVVAIALFFAFASIVIAVFAAIFQNIIREVLEKLRS